MKFLYYSTGVMQILTGYMLAWSVAPGWRWVWVTASVFWFFTGCGLATAWLVKLTARKGRPGGVSRLERGRQAPPFAAKEE